MAFTDIEPVKLGQGAVTTGTTTFYTVGSLKRAIVKTIDICNTSSTSAVSVTVYLVPSGSSASTSNTLVPAVVVPHNGIFQWTGAQVLNEGDTIQATASITGSTITMSGGECS